MLKINLENRLGAYRRNHVDEEKVVSEALAVLNGENKQNVDFLKSIGMTTVTERNDKINRAISGLDRSRIFKESDIKKLCTNYGLRLLHAKRYVGAIDSKLPEKVNEFKEKMVELGRTPEAQHSDDYYICAPKTSFKLSDHPIVHKDPIMFFNLGAGYYYLIHKWGNDISLWRWFKSIRWRSYFAWYLTSALVYWMGLGALLMYTTGFSPWFLLLFGAGSAFHFLFARYCDIAPSSYSYSYLGVRVYRPNWNSIYK